MQKSEIKEKKNFWISAGSGALFTIALVFASLFATASLISSEKISNTSAMIIIQVSSFVCAVFGALLARALNKGKKAFPVAMTSAFIAAILRLVISAMETEGKVFSASDLTIAVCLLCGGTTAFAITAKTKKRKRR